MRARIIRAYIAKPKNIPLISLISQQTVQRDKRDKRVIFPLDSHIYTRAKQTDGLPLRRLNFPLIPRCYIRLGNNFVSLRVDVS